MVYSASSARTLLEGSGDGTRATSSSTWPTAPSGFVALQLASRMDLDAVRRLTPPLLGVAFVLLLLVQSPGIGVEINGATRWIGAGPLQFQPSELMKLALVLYAVNLLASKPKMVLHAARASLSPLLVVVRRGVPAHRLPARPRHRAGHRLHDGRAARRRRHADAAAGHRIGGRGGRAHPRFRAVEPYRRERLTTFLDPWAHAGDAGFQSVQGQIALGSGGLFGLGIGESVQKIFYLPEAHTDFILAVIGEELGVAGDLRRCSSSTG